MKPIERIVYSGVIVFFVFIYFYNSCNKPQEKTIIMADTSTRVQRQTNAAFDAKDKSHFNEIEKKDQRIAYLEDAIKKKVAKIQRLPSKSSKTDTVFISCEEQLSYVNDAINFYDSLVQEYKAKLDSCTSFSLEQRENIKFNRDLLEKVTREKLELIKQIDQCGQFKHIIFRIYRKKE